MRALSLQRAAPSPTPKMPESTARRVAPSGRALLVLAGGASSHSEDGEGEQALDFDSVFRTYAPYVAGVALRILGRDAELDDVVQDVFIQAHRGLKTVRDPGAIKSWLARVTVRRSRRRLMRQRWRRFLRLEEATPVDLMDPAASPEERAQVISIYRLLETLPTDQLIAWVLRHAEGETLERTAELCGCSMSTVQRRLRAAEAFMAERLSTGDAGGRDD